MMTIHVLACGELLQQVLNAMAAFMKQDGFFGLLRLTALMGIIMATIAYLKRHDPLDFAKWLLGYVLICAVVLTPTTTVAIEDIAAQKTKLVDNVPVVFALCAKLITSIGFGLAQSYDALLSMPDDLRYTETGSLFGSKMIQAAREFKVIAPELKMELDGYLRNCVVGDIRLNHKYSVGDLAASTNIWDTIT